MEKRVLTADYRETRDASLIYRRGSGADPEAESPRQLWIGVGIGVRIVAFFEVALSFWRVTNHTAASRWEKVGGRDEFRCRRRKNAQCHPSRRIITKATIRSSTESRRQGSLGEEWERGDLERVGGDGYGPRQAVLQLQRVEVIEE